MRTRPAWRRALVRFMVPMFVVLSYDWVVKQPWLSVLFLLIAYFYAWIEADREKPATGGTTPLQSESQRETVKT